MVSLLQRLTLTILLVLPAAVRAQEFRVDTLARGPQIQLPSSIAFIPHTEGAFLFTEKSGRVRLYDGGLRASPFLTLPVDDEGEQGLMGVAVHPEYPDSPYVYVYYVRALDRAGILERYEDQNGTAAAPYQMLFIPRRDEAMGNNGGKMAFGLDGKLYLAVGDHAFKPSNAQDTLGGRNLRGKILRLNPDGSIPSDNILPRRAFWSIGHRNPGGLSFDPATGVLYVTEGGAQHINEIVAVPEGANLGWPSRRPGLFGRGEAPVVLYAAGRTEPPPGLTGIAVYRSNVFPALRGTILFAGNVTPLLWAGRFTAGGDSLIAEPIYRSNTGFSDVQVGPDGLIYLAVGPYQGSRILRLSPIPPAFTGDPPPSATQGIEYTYAATWTGTRPDLEVLAGPEGMTLDTASATLHWKPTNAQALEGMHTVTLRAHNGAGWADRRFTINVYNVNDPPSPFSLIAPADGSDLRFPGEDPVVILRWSTSTDPDGDSLTYAVDLDTTALFDSPLRMHVIAGSTDSLRVKLSPVSRSYFWRVSASDGSLATANFPGPAHLSIVVTRFLVREKVPHVESVLEQNFPNPFNPSTSIKYVLPRAGYVRLSVFNLLGQEVARLVDGTQEEGTYEIGFTQTNLPSGIYFYRLVAPGYAETKKMVITR
ncbi:MAG: PQQ-dependent sugar dehydrogenase [Bacteroidota bacterium]